MPLGPCWDPMCRVFSTKSILSSRHRGGRTISCANPGTHGAPRTGRRDAQGPCCTPASATAPGWSGAGGSPGGASRTGFVEDWIPRAARRAPTSAVVVSTGRWRARRAADSSPPKRTIRLTTTPEPSRETPVAWDGAGRYLVGRPGPEDLARDRRPERGAEAGARQVGDAHLPLIRRDTMRRWCPSAVLAPSHRPWRAAGRDGAPFAPTQVSSARSRRREGRGRGLLKAADGSTDQPRHIDDHRDPQQRPVVRPWLISKGEDRPAIGRPSEAGKPRLDLQVAGSVRSVRPNQRRRRPADGAIGPEDEPPPVGRPGEAPGIRLVHLRDG